MVREPGAARCVPEQGVLQQYPHNRRREKR
jgi:hypothetical protein